ncbi:hypothetical protein A9Q99_23720 [Gammaproteobacteria bacterium 45_16_T64]|nr:hypothetical protein A9Q99_23720 [Gammaproteobacteria bacterium 45_16_T64]
MFDEVVLLLQRGAQLEDLSRLLNLAAGATSVELVELILDAGAQINHEYTIDEKSGFLAIDGRDLDEIVDEVNLVTIEFCPALMVAAMKGEVDVIRLLLSRGANIFQTDNNGEGLLHYAARGKNIKVVEHLISCGLDVNLQKKNSNEIPAHLCLKDHELLKLFLDNGADPNMEDKWEGTLLDRAYICRASDKTVELLKNYGAKKTKDWIEDDRA